MNSAKVIACIVSIFLLSALAHHYHLSSFRVLAKPPWLKPGVYVEYEIRDAYATNITICADLGTLVELGLVHKFEVNGCVIVTDLEFDELVERLRRAGQWPPRGAGLTILSSRLYRQVLELYRAGKLPKVVRRGSINYGIGGFDIINATYYWRCVGFERGLAVLEVGFLAFLYGVARTCSFLFARHVQKRFKSAVINELFTPLLCFTPVLIYLGYSKILYYASFLLMGIFVGLTYSCSLFTVMEKAGRRRGLYAGFFESAIGLGYMTGPLFGGFTSGFSLSAPYIRCGFIGLALVLTQSILKLVKK